MPRPWLGLAIVSGVLLAVMLVYAAFAQDRPAHCAGQATIAAHLELKYGERRIAMAVVNDSTLAEIYVSETGSWTLIYTMANGVSCLIISGRGWQMMAEVPKGRGS